MVVIVENMIPHHNINKNLKCDINKYYVMESMSMNCWLQYWILYGINENIDRYISIASAHDAILFLDLIGG